MREVCKWTVKELTDRIVNNSDKIPYKLWRNDRVNKCMDQVF